MTTEIIGYLHPPGRRRDPIVQLAETWANAIRMRHGAETIGNPSHTACYMGWDAYREMTDRHEREAGTRPPTPPAIRAAVDEAMAQSIDPHDPRFVRLRELTAKRLPPKLRARWLRGELSW